VAWDPDPARAAAPGLDLPALRPVEVADEVDNDRFVALMLERLSAS
jgi:hypothetical protein